MSVGDRRLRILLIEDDARLHRIIARVLEHEGWQVEIASDGLAGLNAARQNEFDCLIVDRLLPNLDGVELIRTLRAERCITPMLMLTARGDRPDRITGLEAGADDYLGKPFAFEELLARIRALVRRAATPNTLQVITFEDLALDIDTISVTRGGVTIELTAREFAMLKALALNRGRVLSRSELLATAWPGEPDLLEGIVDLYVHYLRRKLDPENTKISDSLIRTVRRVGYALRTG